MRCQYCDELGYCTKYSNETTVWKCRTPCKDYLEVEDV